MVIAFRFIYVLQNKSQSIVNCRSGVTFVHWSLRFEMELTSTEAVINNNMHKLYKRARLMYDSGNIENQQQRQINIVLS